MAGFVRRYDTVPTLAEITAIEGAIIVDKTPSGVQVGRNGGVVHLVGEFAGGPINTPTVVEGDQTITQTFGGMSLSLRNPLAPTVNPYSNGCGPVWIRGKQFRKLVITRVDMRLAEGVNLQLTGGGASLAADVLIPAGTRVRDASAVTREFALAQDIVFLAGTDTTASATTVYTAALQATGFSTRSVSDIPVYSVQGVNENAVGDVDSIDTTDLFRAGIGAGTSNPALVVAASTGLLDGSPANTAVLTALTSGAIDTRYDNALQATLPGTDPVNDDTEIRASARTSVAIRASLLSVTAAAARTGARSACLVRPAIGTAQAGAVATTGEGVGVARSDRRIYCYPHVTQLIPELAELDPQATISSSTVLVGGDAAAACVLSNIPAEDNPGRSTQDELSGGLLQWITGLESGLTTAGQPTVWTETNYRAFKAAGIMAIRRDARISEWVFQSGVTSVDPALFPGRAPVSRRRMADEIQDNLSTISLRYNKRTRRTATEDAYMADMTGYMESLLSRNQPDFQRIADYAIDPEGANTAALQGAGINAKLVQVQFLESNDFMLLITEMGASVVIANETP